jgi:hypothetical protein
VRVNFPADGVRPAADRFREACRADLESLCGGSRECDGLDLLPEASNERFAGFHAVHGELDQEHGQLGRVPAYDAADAVLCAVRLRAVRPRRVIVGPWSPHPSR